MRQSNSYQDFTDAFTSDRDEDVSPSLLDRAKAYFLSEPGAPARGLAYLREFDKAPMTKPDGRLNTAAMEPAHRACNLVYLLGKEPEFPAAVRLEMLKASVDARRFHAPLIFGKVSPALVALSREPDLTDGQRHDALTTAIACGVPGQTDKAAFAAARLALKARDPGVRRGFTELAARAKGWGGLRRLRLCQRLVQENAVPAPHLPKDRGNLYSKGPSGPGR